MYFTNFRKKIFVLHTLRSTYWFYLESYLKAHLKIPGKPATIVLMIINAILIITCILGGTINQKTGRRLSPIDMGIITAVFGTGLYFI
jgi:hypothetical protein